VIVYNGIDPEVFRPLPPDGEIQKKLGFFKGENKTLIYAGRLVGWKGLQVLLKAAALMKEAVPIQLLIVGDGEIRPSLEKLSSELGMEKRVFFAGFVPNQDLPRYYSLADVGVFPSLADETFGISLAEAMACGLPVVSTKIGGIPEVVPEGKAGFLVAPKNPQELAEKILFLLADDRLRKNMGEAARQRVLDHFTWAKAADRLLGVYREVGGVIRPK
jgi:glycosyltransferase involved in cell wall biosynthesis